MANWYVSSVAYAAVTAWATGVTLAVGAICKPTAPASGREYCYRVSAITTGITGATEPTWPLTVNGTVVDGGVTWTECTGQEAYQSAGNWTAPAGTLMTIMDNVNGRGSTTGADFVFLASNHTETWTSARDWSRGGTTLCVTVAGSALPPTAASLTTGAAIITTGASTILMSSLLYFQGITFSSGSGANQSSIDHGKTSNETDVTYQDCSITLAGTSGGNLWFTAAARAAITLINTPLVFGAANQTVTINVLGQALYWQGGSVSGTVPTTLFGNVALSGIVEGVDLSNITTTLLTMNTGGNRPSNLFSMRYCKTNAAVALANAGTWGGPPMFYTAQEGCDSASSIRQRLMAPGGANTTATNIARANSATISGQNVSFALVNAASNSGPNWGGPDCAPGNQDLSPWVWTNLATFGSPTTLTLYLIANKPSKPNANQIWAAAYYLADATSPLMTSYSPANPEIGANLNSPAAGVADTSDWGSLAAARANSTSYAVGAAFGVSSNPTRLFFCTGAGTTAGSLPAGYATAVDGDSVTDGSATFRAGWRLAYAITITPQQAGLAGIRLHYALTENPSLNVYLDPAVSVS